MARRTRLLGSIGALFGLVASACSGSQGSIFADMSVDDLEPRPGSTVSNPVGLRWSADVEAGAESGVWFVVHLDTSMLTLNTSVLPYAGEPCDDVADCLGRGLIAGPTTWLTDQTSIDVGELLPGTHRFTVVLVDSKGVRGDDSAWSASFSVE